MICGWFAIHNAMFGRISRRNSTVFDVDCLPFFHWSLVIGWIPFAMFVFALISFTVIELKLCFCNSHDRNLSQIPVNCRFFFTFLPSSNERTTPVCHLECVLRLPSDEQIVSFLAGNMKTCASIEDKLRCFGRVSVREAEERRNKKNWVWMFCSQWWCLWIYSALILSCTYEDILPISVMMYKNIRMKQKWNMKLKKQKMKT